MVRSESKPVRRLGESPSRVPGSSTARRSRPPKPGENGASTGGKRIIGRKRHILVDTQGNLVVVIVRPANIADRDGADWVLEAAAEKSSRLQHM